MKLDLGCGTKCREGFSGVDIARIDGVVDLGIGWNVDLFQFPWPWATSSVEEVNASHIVEHTPNLIAFMDEIYRVLIPGGFVTIRAPYFTSIRCWQDPTHTRAITDATFCYFDKAWREREGLAHYPIVSDFEQVEIKHWIHPDYNGASENVVKNAMKCMWNVVEDIEFQLRKR